jgi:hypothetical protein
MVFAIKSILSFFMIIGIAIALYGAWEIMETVNFVNAPPGRADQDFHDSSSVMSYPEFES